MEGRTMSPQYYVLEFSPTQRCFHIHQIDEMLEKNQKAFRSGTHSDYFPIHISQFRNELDKLVNAFTQIPELKIKSLKGGKR